VSSLLVPVVLSASVAIFAASGTADARAKKKPARRASVASLVAHPCSVISIGQITALLGTSPVTPAKTDGDGECDYSSASAFNFVNIQIQQGALKQFFKQDAVSSDATEAVKGLGNQAFVTPANLISSNGAGSIFVLVGTTTLRVDVYLQVSSSTLEALAKDAVAKL
jgi:hypothetical protein